MRTRGARDRRRRKIRSDKGRRRKIYRGKPVRKKRVIRGKIHYPKQKKKENIKVEFWLIEKMSYEGYLRIPRKSRPKMRKEVYGRGGNRIYTIVSVYEINTKEKLENYCEQNLYAGTWSVMLRSHKNNLYGNSPCQVAKVRVTEHAEGLRCKLIYNKSLFRRWWWQG